MKSILFLPNQFKINGLWLSLTGVLGMWFVIANGLINVYRVLEPGKTMADGGYPYPDSFMHVNSIIGHLSVALLILGLAFFFFSRERDEYFYRVRLESLQFAVVWQLVATVALGLYFSVVEGVFLESVLPIIITTSAVGFWLLFTLRYCYVSFLKSQKEQ